MNTNHRLWLEATRPKTLPLTLVSIVTGSALSFSSGHFSWIVTALAVLTATLLQILSNLANDYGDAVKGTDNEQRIGPKRAMQSGLIDKASMKRAIVINIVLAVIFGSALVLVSLESLQNILIFIALGLLAIVAAITYTMGNKPYGYFGLGDISVFIFFGLLGVIGSYFLQTGSFDYWLILPSVGCGLLAVSVLNVNNMRDIENDAACGKRTVVVRLGTQRAKRYHLLLLLGAFLAFSTYLFMQSTPVWLSIPFAFSAIVLAKHAYQVWNAPTPRHFIPMMSGMVKCCLIINILFSGVIVVQTITS
ncbi:1,4-dihydroxy-2-naphthoate polyprenyltransferase [Vibrio sp. S4M6]|uniref:1,4-dihydroxy-2-naphthoate polyprenyltransferase n=1 Tax=Vibrio sinus TaxID=2946865 RepID=UPI002029DF83|nr:1,4-dihydroxy-2-naphthoate polyprenyltransferase [Vibrio sinus]MCL9783533.1 1,4-dihydroxy-2-naphthoate polyprenyltransferase [Vibrio sinus]